jgi:SOS-response transcriptional repressor LexA
MVGGNIPPGAMLLVSPAAAVANGQIVLARRGDEEFTVKTLYRKADGTTILQPMNSAFEPLLVEPGEPLTVMRVSEIRIKL